MLMAVESDKMIAQAVSKAKAWVRPRCLSPKAIRTSTIVWRRGRQGHSLALPCRYSVLVAKGDKRIKPRVSGRRVMNCEDWCLTFFVAEGDKLIKPRVSERSERNPRSIGKGNSLAEGEQLGIRTP